MNIFWLLLGGGPFFGWWQIYFGWRWVIVASGGSLLADGEWWWVVVDVFWLVVDGGVWWWVVVGRGEWWPSLV